MTHEGIGSRRTFCPETATERNLDKSGEWYLKYQMTIVSQPCILTKDDGPVIHTFSPPRSWFVRQEPPESDEVLAQRREVETAMLERLFGLRWPAMTPERRQIARVLMQEVAPRHDGRRPGGRADVRLLIGSPPDLGPDSAGEARFRSHGPVPFWANGGNALRGPSCSLYGSFRGGLLVRCGYAKARESVAELKKKLPPFLKDLKDVADALGVDVGSRDLWYGRYRSLEEMQSSARCELGLENLLSVRVVIGASENYLWRWNQFFAKSERYQSPTSRSADYVATGNAGADDLFVRLDRLGLTQRQLAIVLNVCPSQVTRLKLGQRRWSSRLLAQAETFVAGAESHVVGTVQGRW